MNIIKQIIAIREANPDLTQQQIADELGVQLYKVQLNWTRWFQLARKMNKNEQWLYLTVLELIDMERHPEEMTRFKFEERLRAIEASLKTMEENLLITKQ